MVIDSRGKLFGKISIIDIMIVVILMAAIAGVGYKFSKSGTIGSSAKADDLEIVFYAEEVPDYAAQAIKIGDIVKDGVQNSTFGRVKDIKIGDSVSWAQAENGEWFPSTKKGYVSIYITAEGKGIFEDSGVSIDSSDYFIGLTIDRLRAGNSAFNFVAIIHDIKKKG